MHTASLSMKLVKLPFDSKLCPNLSLPFSNISLSHFNLSSKSRLSMLITDSSVAVAILYLPTGSIFWTYHRMHKSRWGLPFLFLNSFKSLMWIIVFFHYSNMQIWVNIRWMKSNLITQQYEMILQLVLYSLVCRLPLCSIHLIDWHFGVTGDLLMEYSEICEVFLYGFQELLQTIWSHDIRGTSTTSIFKGPTLMVKAPTLVLQEGVVAHL